MKIKTITRLLIGVGLCAVIVSPTLTLTSCASISQWLLPITIGGMNEKSPWSEVKTDNVYDLRGYDNLDGSPTSYFSPAHKFSDYLPDSFISYTDRSSSNTDNYEYATVYNDVNWNKTLEQEPNKPQYYDPQWVNYNTSNLTKMSETYDIGSGDSKKTLTTYTSMQNLNLYNALSLNSIASAVNVYVSALIKLMTEDAVMRNPTTADQWYNAIFGDINGNKNYGGFSHGADNKDQINKNFYEFLFDTLDTLSQGKSPFKFAESAANYKFKSQIYGPGPYISWNNENGSDALKQFVGWTDSAHDIGQQFVFTEDQLAAPDDTVLTLAGGANPDQAVLSNNFLGINTTNDDVPDVSTRGAYTLFTSATTNKDDLTKNVFYPTTIGVQIPFIISPDTFSYSYYNPLVKYNFQPNDYLLNDITPVAKQVSSTNAWNSFSKFVDDKTFPKNEWCNNLSWNFNTNPNASAHSSLPKADSSLFYPSYNTTDLANALNQDKPKAAYVDPTLVTLLSQTSTTSGVLSPSDYIGFANYTFVPFPLAASTPDNIKYECMPVFSGLAYDSDTATPAVFPVSLLYKTPDLDANKNPQHPQEIDTDLFKAQMMPEAGYVYNYKNSSDGSTPYKSDNFKNNVNNNMWYLDLSKLFKKQTGAYKLFNENIDIKKDPMFYYNNNKDTFQTLWDLYGKWVFNQTNATWSMDKTSSSDLFMPI